MPPPLRLSPALLRRPRCPREAELPAIRLNPVPFGWSEVGGTLFFRFAEAPPSILAWALGEERVAQRPKRKTGYPRYMVAVVPNSVSLFQYGGEMEELEGWSIGVCHEDNPRLLKKRIAEMKQSKAHWTWTSTSDKAGEATPIYLLISPANKSEEFKGLVWEDYQLPADKDLALWVETWPDTSLPVRSPVAVQELQTAMSLFNTHFDPAARWYHELEMIGYWRTPSSSFWGAPSSDIRAIYRDTRCGGYYWRDAVKVCDCCVPGQPGTREVLSETWSYGPEDPNQPR